MFPNLVELFCRFGMSLGEVSAFVHVTLQSDEILAEFASRGVTTAQLNNLAGAIKEVSNVFYNDARPE